MYHSRTVGIQVARAGQQMAEMGRKMAVDASAEGKGSRASAEAQASAAADRARLEHQVGQLAAELAAAQNAAATDCATLEERLAELDKQLHSARSAIAEAETRAEQRGKVTSGHLPGHFEYLDFPRLHHDYHIVSLACTLEPLSRS